MSTLTFERMVGSGSDEAARVSPDRFDPKIEMMDPGATDAGAGAKLAAFTAEPGGTTACVSALTVNVVRASARPPTDAVMLNAPVAAPRVTVVSARPFASVTADVRVSVKPAGA